MYNKADDAWGNFLSNVVINFETKHMIDLKYPNRNVTPSESESAQATLLKKSSQETVLNLLPRVSSALEFNIFI